MPEEKKRLQSLTYTSNTLVLIGSILAIVVPAVSAVVPAAAPIAAGVLAIWNMIMRERTKVPLAPLIDVGPDLKNSAPLWLTMLLVAGLAGCKSTSPEGGIGMVGSVTVGRAGAAPTALVRFDGNTLVAWGSEAFVAEVYVQASGLPVLVQAGEAEVAFVYRIDPEYSWRGRRGDELPAECAFHFRQGEVDAWGLRFASAVPTVAPAPVPPAPVVPSP